MRKKGEAKTKFSNLATTLQGLIEKRKQYPVASKMDCEIGFYIVSGAPS